MCDSRSFSLRVKRVFNCVKIWNKDKSLSRVNTSTLFHDHSPISKQRKCISALEEGGNFSVFPAQFYRIYLNAAPNWRSSEQQKNIKFSIRVTFSNCEALIREQINDAVKVKKKFFSSVSEILRRNVSVTKLPRHFELFAFYWVPRNLHPLA